LKRFVAISPVLVLVLFVLPLADSPVVLSAAPVSIVSSAHGSAQSTNWSGYAVTGSSGSITVAGGSWVVPAVSCPSSGKLYSSFWVGIDGYQSSTVEQTGTDSDCVKGVPSYYAWYEFYPNPSHQISNFPVRPGDVVAAKVAFASGTFKIAIEDMTTGQIFSTSGKVSGAARNSAEFIVEAPATCVLIKCKITPLANFGTAGFGYDDTNVAMTCDLIMNGVTGPIGSFQSGIQQITMVSNSHQVKAQPSPLSADGTSFSVQWLSSGP
jgi:Peptidase A4 family